MRITLLGIVLGTTLMSCSKDLAEDEVIFETLATEGDDEEEKNKPGNN